MSTRTWDVNNRFDLSSADSSVGQLGHLTYSPLYQILYEWHKLKNFFEGVFVGTFLAINFQIMNSKTKMVKLKIILSWGRFPICPTILSKSFGFSRRFVDSVSDQTTKWRQVDQGKTYHQQVNITCQVGNAIRNNNTLRNMCMCVHQ